MLGKRWSTNELNMSSKKILLAILLIIGIAAGYWLYVNFLKTAPSMHKQETQHQITAVDLYNEFDSDEEKANNLYLNQVVEVTGVIESVQASEDSNPVITLQTEGFGVVNATLASIEEMEGIELNEGQSVTIKGECIGLLLDVLITNSIILKY